jgi:hypothetical protein
VSRTACPTADESVAERLSPDGVPAGDSVAAESAAVESPAASGAPVSVAGPVRSSPHPKANSTSAAARAGRPALLG